MWPKLDVKKVRQTFNACYVHHDRRSRLIPLGRGRRLVVLDHALAEGEWIAVRGGAVIREGLVEDRGHGHLLSVRSLF